MSGSTLRRRVGAVILIASASISGALIAPHAADAAPPQFSNPPDRLYTAMNAVLPFDGHSDPITGDTAAIDPSSVEGDDGTCDLNDPTNLGDTVGECVEVQLQVDNGPGTLSVINSGVEIYQGTGTDDAQMNFRGKLSDVESTLQSLVYTPPNDFETTDSNPVSLLVTVWDAKPINDQESAQLEVDIRVEGDNAWPELTAPQDDPYDVEVNQQFTILESAGTEDFSVTDEDVDQDEVDDYLLGVAWVDCGEINFPVGGGVLGEPETLLTQAGIDPTLIPAMVPNNLAYSTSSNDPAPAVAWLAGIDTFNDAMRWIVFTAPATAGTCTLTMVVTDLGNNGMPFPDEIPMPGVDFDSVEFNVTDPNAPTTTTTTSIPDDSTTTTTSMPDDSTTTTTSVPDDSTTTTSMPGDSTTTTTTEPDGRTTTTTTEPDGRTTTTTSMPGDSTTTTTTMPGDSTTTTTTMPGDSTTTTTTMPGDSTTTTTTQPGDDATSTTTSQPGDDATSTTTSAPPGSTSSTGPDVSVQISAPICSSTSTATPTVATTAPPTAPSSTETTTTEAPTTTTSTTTEPTTTSTTTSTTTTVVLTRPTIPDVPIVTGPIITGPIITVPVIPGPLGWAGESRALPDDHRVAGAPCVNTPGGTLPATGSTSYALVAVGALMVLAGATLTLRARRPT